ncbi:SLBB domain protein [Roseimaritima multifibrata]|uniref:SLBB domain protein n=1 Tax=Roseimaritima multifibrata TaxID=1930274 RepID=A0A517MP64_9BACT|nr:polysaccharide biosynthesis/export family protein [Roseimaritima multifibrata]QDS96664.1 SLBB domain protein [Roseimaritima multifibrata]
MNQSKPNQPLMLLAMLLLSGTVFFGCRTAASLGLPISAGSNTIMSDAVALRQQQGHPQGIATELAKVPLPPHPVEAGDVLVIEPNDFNSPIRLSSDQTVQQDGTIELGAYGRMQVAGLPPAEIQNRVQHVITEHIARKQQEGIGLASHTGQAGALDPSIDYGVTVRLVNQESAMFYVMGEVNAPGSYPLVGHETVLDALIAAGGLSDRANDHKIILTRPQPAGQPRIILPVCYRQVLQMGDVSTNYQLRPGDRIYVPSLSLWEDIKQSVSSSEKSCPHCSEYQLED